MPDSIWPWLDDIHKIIGPQWAGVLCTVSSVFCGALIGIERQRARKPTGLRTLVLICLGSAIFTQASILMIDGQTGDRSRIAAQIVAGIGFLGAGAIIREGGMLVGVTTAAGIWATAAVGVVLGSGHIAAGLFFTLLILATLAGARAADRLVMGPCVVKTLRLVIDPREGRTALRIQARLDTVPHDLKITVSNDAQGRTLLLVDHCTAHHDHRAFIGDIIDLPGVLAASVD